MNRIAVWLKIYEAVRIDDYFGILEYVWEWPSKTYPENYRMRAPENLSEKEYYSRFVQGLWVIPDTTEELDQAASAARHARFEFGEKPI